MKPTLTTKYALVVALLTGGPLADTDGKPILSITNSVEREDGSNRSFNVAGYQAAGRKVAIYVRTVD